MKETWRVLGFDAFDEEYYPLSGDFETEDGAKKLASEKFDQINLSQPDEQSSGQDDDGIQDRLFIEKPDGSLIRFLPLSPETNQ